MRRSDAFRAVRRFYRRIVLIRALVAAAAVFVAYPVLAAAPVQTLYVSGWLGFDGSVAWPAQMFPNQVPAITDLSPKYVTAGKPGVTLTLTGNFFNTGSSAFWNGSSRPTQYVSATQVLVSISAGDIANPGTNQVIVNNPGAPVSNSQTVAVVPLPTVGGFKGLGPFTPLDATLQLDAQGAAQIQWVLLPLTPGVSVVQDRALSSSIPAGAQTITTQSPALSLSTLNLSPGQCQIQAIAYNLAGDSAPPAAANTTFVTDDLSAVRVYPNPWRSDKDGDIPVTFDRLPLNITIKVFDVSGRWVKELTTPGASATWDLTNESGQRVASGIYLYLIQDSQGQKRTGKMVIIK